MAVYADGRGDRRTAGIVRGTIGGIRRQLGEGKDGGGGTHTAGNWNNGRKCVNQDEGDCRGRRGMGNNVLDRKVNQTGK